MRKAVIPKLADDGPHVTHSGLSKRGNRYPTSPL